MAKQPRPLIAGNWKMNGTAKPAVREAKKLVTRAIRARPLGIDVVICPPAPLLSGLRDVLRGSRIALGGQDCHAEPAGAHTGDISAEMLSDMGCKYVIVGHSERRTDHGESSREVRDKLRAALRAGLTGIVCVGETAGERRRGQTIAVVGAQMRDSLDRDCTAENTVIAYEPVWAIGSGETPTPEDVAEVHAYIRQRLNRRFGTAAEGMRILYGGSVKAGNAAELMAVENVDGALVGGASLTADDFWPIVESKLGG